MKKILRCEICGEEFFTEYWESGSINHDNGKMSGSIIRLYDNDEREDLLKKILGLDGNLCNIKNIDKRSAILIFKCNIISLCNAGRKDIASYLEALSIDKEFNILYDRLIEEKESEIENMKKGIKRLEDQKVGL